MEPCIIVLCLFRSNCCSSLCVSFFAHSNRATSFVLVFVLFSGEKSSLGLHVPSDMEVSQTHTHTQYKESSGWGLRFTSVVLVLLRCMWMAVCYNRRWNKRKKAAFFLLTFSGWNSLVDTGRTFCCSALSVSRIHYHLPLLSAVNQKKKINKTSLRNVIY